MKLPFDKCYCLHLAENKDRYENFMSEFKRLGIEDQVEVWWTTKRKVSVVAGDMIQSLHDSYYDCFKQKNKDVYGGVFNCSFEHYTMIKQAYERGMNSILVMEDDIKFIDDLNTIQKYMDNIPEDYDIIRFWTTMKLGKTDDELYMLNNPKFVNSTLCYAVSRNGMKLIIDQYDKEFNAADVVLNKLIGNCKFYVSKDFLCYPGFDDSDILVDKINIVNNQLVFDLGLFLCDTSKKYLTLGLNVVGVECNPNIYKTLNEMNKKYDNLFLENKCISDKSNEEISFYISNHADWSSCHKEIAERESKSTEIKVKTITLADLIRKYSCPVYCKIDIEGNDIVALKSLHEISDRPQFISCETECIGNVDDNGEKTLDVLNELISLGYKKFKIMKQPQSVYFFKINGWVDADTAKEELLNLKKNHKHRKKYDFWADVYATF